jgi:Family of unknown function (DUF5760)
METKEQLIHHVKTWVKLDNDIRVLQKELASKKTQKKEISAQLMETMKKNAIDCFDIKDGQICYTKKNVKKPITSKKLLELLSTYYSGDLLKANEVNDFLLGNREEIVKEEIVRKVKRT